MKSFFTPIKRAQELERFFDSLVVEIDLSQEEVKLLRSMIVGTAYQTATGVVSKNLLKPYLRFYKELSHTVENQKEEVSGVRFSHQTQTT